jgi:hypothetical protein
MYPLSAASCRKSESPRDDDHSTTQSHAVAQRATPAAGVSPRVWVGQHDRALCLQRLDDGRWPLQRAHRIPPFHHVWPWQSGMRRRQISPRDSPSEYEVTDGCVVFPYLTIVLQVSDDGGPAGRESVDRTILTSSLAPRGELVEHEVGRVQD